MVEKIITDLFSEVGYQSNILRLQPFKIDTFKSKILDVFVSDLSLGNKYNYDGLNIIKNIKINFPDILVIGISKTNIKYFDVTNRVPTFDLFIHKVSAEDKDYKEYLKLQIKNLFKKNTFAFFDQEKSILSEEFTKSSNYIELQRILRSVTFTNHATPGDADIERIILTPLQGGFSASEVYQMKAYTKNDLQCINAVLKLSDAKQAEKEINNYTNYVKWYIPYTWRVELLGVAIAGKWGGLCYSFAYNDDVDFYPLSHFIRIGDDEKITRSINMIFNPTHQRWYHPLNVKNESGEELKQYYRNRWFYSGSDSENEFFKCLDDSCSREQDQIVTSDFTYPMPKAYLFSKLRWSYNSCIRHGDLHGGNILLTEKGDISFIDFQNTGRGHVFEDFVIFEMSIRADYLKNDREWKKNLKCEDLIKHEFDLFDADKDNLLPYSKHIKNIRNSAQGNFHFENWNNYAYALAVWCYRLLRAKALDKFQKQLCASCLLACMRYLLIKRNS